MDSQLDFQPNWASIPGNTINDILQEQKLSLSGFAQKMNTTTEYIENLILGNITITNTVASQLAQTLGSSQEFWIRREKQYREAAERLKMEEGAAWLKELPVADMIKNGWIENAKDKVSECLKFFGVPDVRSWRSEYANLVQESAFRTSTTFSSEFGSVATWLRRGEVLGSDIKCKNWNEKLFAEKLPAIKSLTRKKNPKDFLPELVKLCADCGVAVVIAKTPNGCRASGATRFIADNKALLLLSFRYLSDDHFWFTFFHEAGHLVLHNKKKVFIETDSKTASNEEAEANAFAGEILIPNELHQELSKLRGNKRSLISFAMKAGVSPGIVVGQLQHFGYIEPRYLNAYKRRYDWDDILQ
jgi:HTH-type transcriptional regulator/antitoxin HigA